MFGDVSGLLVDGGGLLRGGLFHGLDRLDVQRVSVNVPQVYQQVFVQLFPHGERLVTAWAVASQVLGVVFLHVAGESGGVGEALATNVAKVSRLLQVDHVDVGVVGGLVVETLAAVGTPAN